MLPFPRLVEYGNTVQTALLDVNFNNSTVGSTTVTDAAGHVFSKVGTGSAVVVNDATKGNVMQFSGSSYFTTPMASNISLSNLHFKMRIVFKSTVSSENMVFSTGDYYSSGSIVGGILLYSTTQVLNCFVLRVLGHSHVVNFLIQLILGEILQLSGFLLRRQ